MTKSEKRKIANKVLNSKIFYRSNIYHKLLDYLVEKNIKNKVPKEIELAENVFNKGSDFNSSEDTSVRVHVHNLRKKLSEYYHEEGPTDEVRLTIPKGHYQLFFEKTAAFEEAHQKTAPLKKNRTVILVVSGIAWFVLAYLFFAGKFAPSTIEKIDNNNRFWSHYFGNKLKTTVIIGDFLVFHEYDKALGRTRRIQDYQINNRDSLLKFADTLPLREIEPWVIGELPHNILFNIIDLYPVFISFDKTFEIAFSSEIDIGYIKNRNIIYIGEFKNLRSLENLTSALPIETQTLPWWDGRIIVKADSIQQLETYHKWEKSRYVVDLGMIAKLPGQNGENYLFFAGFGYNSQIKMVKLLATGEGLEFLEDAIKTTDAEIPDYFVSILEISGFDRASTKADIKFYSAIADDYFYINNSSEH